MTQAQPVIVNNPGRESDSGSGFLIRVVLLIIVGVFAVYFILPYFQRTMNRDVQINIPKTVDVNVQQK